LQCDAEEILKEFLQCKAMGLVRRTNYKIAKRTDNEAIIGLLQDSQAAETGFW